MLLENLSIVGGRAIVKDSGLLECPHCNSTFARDFVRSKMRKWGKDNRTFHSTRHCPNCDKRLFLKDESADVLRKKIDALQRYADQCRQTGETEECREALREIENLKLEFESLRNNLPVNDSVSTYHFEGKLEDWKKLVLSAFPNAVIGPNYNGYSAKVGGIDGEEVGSIGEIKPGVYRGGYRKELQGKFGKDSMVVKSYPNGWAIVQVSGDKLAIQHNGETISTHEGVTNEDIERLDQIVKSTKMSDSKTKDQTPSQYFNLPVKKTIRARSPLNEKEITTYEVIGEDANTYVVNQWYKEYNHTPQMIPKMFVDDADSKQELEAQLKELYEQMYKTKPNTKESRELNVKARALETELNKRAGMKDADIGSLKSQLDEALAELRNLPTASGSSSSEVQMKESNLVRRIHDLEARISGTKDSSEETQIIVSLNDPDGSLIKFLEALKSTANPGHSFEVIMDPDGDEPQKFGFDGDGAFRIGDIKYPDRGKTKDVALPVGNHNDAPDSDFDADELAKGIKIESEHTDDPEIAKAIAKDHLKEIPDYYTRLDKMEKEAKK
jgi:hypothetical protein